MMSSTVTTITALKTTDIPPAIAEVRTADQERFPVFDPDVRDALLDAMDRKLTVYLTIWQGEHAEYVRDVTPIDVEATTRLCVWCEHGCMTRAEPSATNGNVPQFVCSTCHRRLYLARVEATKIELPSTARARLNRLTDGLFALDHLHLTATLMESFPREAGTSSCYIGAIHGELQPYQDTFVLDGDGLVPYRRSGGWSGAGDPLPSNLTLRLMGVPFHGRTSYQVL